MKNVSLKMARTSNPAQRWGSTIGAVKIVNVLGGAGHMIAYASTE